MKYGYGFLTVVMMACAAVAVPHNHIYVDGVCCVSGCDDPYQRVPLGEDGKYRIGNAGHLCWFAMLVNTANGKSLDAMLVADIDLSSVANFPIIGASSTSPYKGVFDGQGYAITNLKVESDGLYVGLFGDVDAATIKNFSISGSVVSTNTGKSYVGAIGRFATSTTFTVQDIYSSLTIRSCGENNKSGGIAAGCADSISPTLTIDRCWFDGVIDAGNTSVDCCAGIIGYVIHKSKIQNCLFSGEIRNVKSGSNVGGILGWVNNTNFQGLYNCLSIGTLCSGASRIGAITGGYNDTICSGRSPVGCYGNNHYTDRAAGNCTYTMHPYDGFDNSRRFDPEPVKYLHDDVRISDLTLLKALGVANWQQSSCTAGSYPVPGTHMNAVCPHPEQEGVTDGRCNLCGGPVSSWLEVQPTQFGVSSPAAGLHNPGVVETPVSLSEYEITDEHGWLWRCVGYVVNGVRYVYSGDAGVVLTAEQMARGVVFAWVWDLAPHEHAYTNGFCYTHCHEYAQRPEALTNCYQIANAGNLYYLAELVNRSGGSPVGAVLAADIDLSPVDNFPIIGREGHEFNGVFDGQGHSIKNLKISSDAEDCGLFGRVATTETVIRNFSVSGSIDSTVKTSSSHVGTIAKMYSDSKLTIADVHSSVRISSVGEKNKVGGIFAGDRGEISPTVVINRCWYDGVIDKGASQIDCVGGIMSYTFGETLISNCLFNGSILNVSAATKSGSCGGILGYVNYNGFRGIANCLSIGYVGSGAEYVGSVSGRIRKTDSPQMTSVNYYTATAKMNATNKDTPYDGAGSALWVTKPVGLADDAEEISNGSLCELLGSSDWHQHREGGKSFPAPGAKPMPRRAMMMIIY